MVNDPKFFQLRAESHSLILVAYGGGVGNALEIWDSRTLVRRPNAEGVSTDMGLSPLLALAASKGPKLSVYVSVSSDLHAFAVSEDGFVKSVAVANRTERRGEFWVATTLTLGHDIDGKVIGVYATTRDKTATGACALLDPQTLETQHVFDVTDVSAISVNAERLVIAHRQGLTVWVVGSFSKPLKTLKSLAGCVAVALSRKVMFAAKPGTNRVLCWGCAGRGTMLTLAIDAVNDSDEFSIDEIEALSDTSFSARFSTLHNACWVSTVILADVLVDYPVGCKFGQCTRVLTASADTVLVSPSCDVLIGAIRGTVTLWNRYCALDFAGDVEGKNARLLKPFKQMSLEGTREISAIEYDQATASILCVSDGMVLACPLFSGRSIELRFPSLTQLKLKAEAAAATAARSVHSAQSLPTTDVDATRRTETEADRAIKIRARQQAKDAKQLARQKQGKRADKARSQDRGSKYDRA